MKMYRVIPQTKRGNVVLLSFKLKTGHFISSFYYNICMLISSILVFKKLTNRDMMQHWYCSALRHLPTLYNRRNYCNHIQVYLFVRVHMCPLV